MKYINQCFLQNELSMQGNGFLPFIEWSTSEIVRQNGFTGLPIQDYKICSLFYYIISNIRSTLAQFYNYNIENDFLGFPSIQRELRHSIEAFLDLYNLAVNTEYENVLLYCSNKQERAHIDLGKYKDYLYKEEFTIQSKYNISKLNNSDLIKLAKKANSYTHPNVYLDLKEINENKEKLLLKLLAMNVYLLGESFEVFIKGLQTYGFSTSLLNNIITTGGYQYKYMELYNSKKASINSIINSLIIYQPNPVYQNYTL